MQWILIAIFTLVMLVVFGATVAPVLAVAAVSINIVVSTLNRLN